MEKRYQVFVSSTFTDLFEERQNVIQALLELDCIPAGMELFSASDSDQWSLIQEVISDCDYYIVIIGGRYGSTTAEGVSFTEKEFDYAVSINKPILAFLHENPENIPAGKTEINPDARERLSTFREKAESDRVCKYWNSPDDLGGKVSRSLIKLIKRYPAEGWVRGRFAASHELLTQVTELQEENHKLESQLALMGEALPSSETNQFAGGVDTFVIEGTKEVGPDKTTEDWSLELTWDEIFAFVGPSMYDECSEDQMIKFLSDNLQAKVLVDSSEKIHGFQVSIESFSNQKVKSITINIRDSDSYIRQELLAEAFRVPLNLENKTKADEKN